jgi:DNA/RNA-binding domain of Phe-tRNA-synthetase-like protein
MERFSLYHPQRERAMLESTPRQMCRGTHETCDRQPPVSLRYHMKRLIVSEDIFESYPDFKVGVLTFSGVNNNEPHPDVVALLRKGEERMRDTIGTTPLNEYPTIAAWRAAHKKFGSNPKDYPPSILAIAKRVMKGDVIPNINPLVDLYNYIGMKYAVSVGGEDIDTIEGDMVMDYARGDEPYFQIGSLINEPPARNEVIYKDARGAICRRFNWRECDRTKLTSDTTRPVLLMETFPPTTDEDIANMQIELQALVERYCGGMLVTKAIISISNPSAVLQP